jgi:hypothetical protein
MNEYSTRHFTVYFKSYSSHPNIFFLDSSQPETTTTNGSATISQFWSFLNENSTEEIPSNSLNETEISFEEPTTG